MNSFLQRRATVVLILLLGVVLPIFLQLGGRGLNEPDEGRYSEMGREMVVTGDWLVPRLNGVPHYAKPPWIYWCIAASLKVFGMNEWAARLPSALAALVTALLVFDLGRRMGGTRAGIFSALALTSSLLFFVVARLISPDMMLTACITTALYCFWRWWNSEPRSTRWLVGFFFAVGIGFFDKGPFAIGVSFLAIFGFLALERKFSELKRPCFWIGLLLGLILIAAISLPWFLIICHLNPDLYDFYLHGQITDRIISGGGRAHSFFYHFAWLPGDCWPWSILIACAVAGHFRWWKTNDTARSVSSFLLPWFVLPLLMFSLTSSKLPTYPLPLTVPLSLMLGTWLSRVTGNDGLPAPARLLTSLLLPAPVAGVIWFACFKTNLPQTLTQKLLPIACIALGCFLVGLTFHWMINRTKGFDFTRGLLAWWIVALIFLHGILFKMDQLEASFGHNSSWKVLTEPLAGIDLVGVPINLDLHPTGKKPAFARPGPRVLMYEFYFRSCSFYLMKQKNEVVPLYAGSSLWEIGKDVDAEAKPIRSDLVELLKGPETVYVFTRPQHRKELQQLTGMELPLVAQAASGEHELVLFQNRKRL